MTIVADWALAPGSSTFFERVSGLLAKNAKFRCGSALQPSDVDGRMTSSAATILVGSNAKDRLVYLAHLLSVPVVQTVEQVDPAAIGGLVEPIGVSLDLFLLPADMLQRHDDLIAALP